MQLSNKNSENITPFLKTAYHKASAQQTLAKNHSVDPQIKLSTFAFQRHLSIESSACSGQKWKRLGEWGRAYQGLRWWTSHRICLYLSTAARLITCMEVWVQIPARQLALSLAVCPYASSLISLLVIFLICNKEVVITVATSKKTYGDGMS